MSSLKEYATFFGQFRERFETLCDEPFREFRDRSHKIAIKPTPTNGIMTATGLNPGPESRTLS